MTEQERQALFIKNYQDNQSFIDKLTLTASLGSIPLAIGFIDNISRLCCCGKTLFIVANFCAVMVVIAHIIGAIYGKKVCDAELKRGGVSGAYWQKQHICNWIVNIAFIVMLVCYLAIIHHLVYGG